MEKDPINKIPLRIVIGVTGHRELEHRSEIQESIKKILREIEDKYPARKNTKVEFSVISPLAEGADRLVPQTIIKERPETKLTVVLPLVKLDYEKDFNTEGSRKEFNDLLQQCRYPISLRKKPLDLEYPEDMLKKARGHAYKKVGEFVADFSDILIAIWDKKKARGLGGTGEIVKYAQKTGQNLYVIDSNNPKEFEYYQGIETVNGRYKKIQLFNRELDRYDKAGIDRKEKYTNFHYKKINSEKLLDEGNRKKTFDLFLPYYKVSSLISKKFRRLYRWVGMISFWLAFLAVAIVSGGVVFFNTPPVVFLLEAFILLTILVMVTVADKKRSHRNWLENRFLTERIRAAVFFSLCEVKMPPFLISRQHFDKDKNGIWMLTVLEEILSQVPEDARSCRQPVEDLKQFIREAWIDDQEKYHKREVKDKSRINHTLESFGIGIFYSAIGFALIHFFSHMISAASDHTLLSNLLTMVAILLPALAATLEGIRGHRQYKMQIARGRKTVNDLNNLKTQLDLSSSQQFEKMLRSIEDIMIKENEEWMSVMNHSKLYKVV